MNSVYESLCYYDDRNPDYIYLDEDTPKPRDSCSCDNCFYNRDELALHIIYLEEKIEAMKTADIIFD